MPVHATVRPGYDPGKTRANMSRHTLPTDPSIEITLRRSKAARRFSLRVSRIDGAVTLSMPAHAREAEALGFAAGQADWLRRALERARVVQPVGIGSVIPIEGQATLVVGGAVRSVRMEVGALLVPDDPARAGSRVAAYLRLRARQRLQAESERYAALLGRSFTRITLRDTRSRWGSCAPDGSLMYSWRLILAPPEVLSYVAAHEVAHLAEMNHSARFWAVVARLMPDYERQRRWLRTHGTGLHAYTFGAQG
jgi:predicted metal-dependent hydrolase